MSSDPGQMDSTGEPCECAGCTSRRIAEIDKLREETIPKLSLRAAMARAGLANGQRSPWWDDCDHRIDPLTERDKVACLLAELDALLEGHP